MEGSPHLGCTTNISFEQGTPNPGAVAFSSAKCRRYSYVYRGPSLPRSVVLSSQHSHALAARAIFPGQEPSIRDRFSREPSQTPPPPIRQMPMLYRPSPPCPQALVGNARTTAAAPLPAYADPPTTVALPPISSRPLALGRASFWVRTRST